MPNGNNVEAEVVGFHGDRLYLMPANDVRGLSPGAKVIPWDHAGASPVPGDARQRRRRASDQVRRFPVGDGLLGRVVDGAGRPLDGLGPLKAEHYAPLTNQPINPLDREPISEVLDVGVRAINALLTVGRGQRMGLFAGSGVGKSVLLGMMARYTSADVIVVGLIGERGREVKEFIEHILGPEGLARSVVVAAPADTSPLVRLQGASYATSIAEYFRDQGKNVLLIMDSLTRYAMAQREIALAIGEPPATKGYPPVGVRQTAAAGRTGGQWPERERFDHRLLHRADGGRRPAGPDRRCGARDPGRPCRAFAPARRERPLSCHRYRSFDQPRHDEPDTSRSISSRCAASSSSIRVISARAT